VGKGLNASQGRIPAGASAMTRHLTPLRISVCDGLARHSGCCAVADSAGRSAPGDWALLSVGAHCKEVSSSPSNPDFWSFRRRSVESFVNYLLMGQGAVLGRAVSTLRSVEAHPTTLDSPRLSN
jgi:hypothetical protein